MASSKIIIAVIIGLIVVAAVVVGVVLGITLKTNCDTAGAPTNLIFSKINQNISLSWLRPELHESCEVLYVIHYSIDDGDEEEVLTRNLFYDVPSLIVPCSSLHVQIWTRSESGEQSNEYLVGDYTETLHEVPQVSNILVASTPEGIVLRYADSLNLEKCNAKYIITVITDLGLFEYETDVSMFTITNDVYCSSVAATIRRVIGAASSKTRYVAYNSELEAVEDIQLLNEEPNKIRISWAAHPYEKQCSINYRIIYSVDGEVDHVTQTAALTTSFDIIYCANAVISVSAFNFKTLSTSKASTKSATQMPNEIGKITDLDILFKASKYVASWSPVNIRNCDTKYVVTLVTDVDLHMEIIDEPSYNIPEDKYCSSIEIHVSALMGTQIGESESIAKTLDLQSVQNLDIKALSSSNKLIVIWTAHSKHILCGLQYKVVYSVDGEDDNEETTSTGIAVFSFTYCATATVSVTPYNEQITGDIASLSATQFPTSIGAVQNVNIDVVDTTATISWALPSNVKLCPIEHTVTATNDEELQSTCTGFTTCTLTLNDFCSSTTFEINAIDIPGDPYEETHDCNSSF